MKNKRVIAIIAVGLLALLATGGLASLPPTGADSVPIEEEPASLSTEDEARGDIAATVTTPPISEQARKECPCASKNSALPDVSFPDVDAILANKPAFLFFYADWCHYCHEQMPIIAELEQEYGGRAAFIRINADEEPALKQEFDVTSYPTMIIIWGKSGGEYEVEKLKGLTGKEGLEAAIEHGISQFGEEALSQSYAESSSENVRFRGEVTDVWFGLGYKYVEIQITEILSDPVGEMDIGEMAIASGSWLPGGPQMDEVIVGDTVEVYGIYAGVDYLYNHRISLETSEHYLRKTGNVCFRGEVIEVTILMGGVKVEVEVDEILFDPEDNLDEGDLVIVSGGVYEGGPEIDTVVEGDRVEVYGVYEGIEEGKHQVSLETSDHYLRKIAAAECCPCQITTRDPTAELGYLNPARHTDVIVYFEPECSDTVCGLVTGCSYPWVHLEGCGIHGVDYYVLSDNPDIYDELGAHVMDYVRLTSVVIEGYGILGDPFIGGYDSVEQISSCADCPSEYCDPASFNVSLQEPPDEPTDITGDFYHYTEGVYRATVDAGEPGMQIIEVSAPGCPAIERELHLVGSTICGQVNWFLESASIEGCDGLNYYVSTGGHGLHGRLEDYDGKWVLLSSVVFEGYVDANIPVISNCDDILEISDCSECSSDKFIDGCTEISSPGDYILTYDIHESAAQECIRITASDVTFDGNGHYISAAEIIDGGPLRYAVHVAGSDGLSNVTVKNTYIQADWDIGISFTGVTGGEIDNNTISGEEEYGIVLDSCSNCDVTDNEVNSNQDGICLMNSSDNNITNNSAQANYSGICLFWSSGNTITGNTAFMNCFGIDLYESSNDNTIVQNKVEYSGYHGLYIDGESTGNTIQQNIVCLSGQLGGEYRDIYIEDANPGPNSGDYNACDTTHSWTDTGTTGCTYSCDEAVEGPRLCTTPDPPDHDFGAVPKGETRSWSFNITNCGCGIGTLNWSVSSNQSWITVDPASGSSITEPNTVTVTINTTGLEPCVTHNGTITIDSNDGTKTGTISVYPTGPKLCTNPNPPDHDFGNVPKGEMRLWSFDITNCGCDSGTLNWSIDSDESWITADPTGGSTTTETDTITITINTTDLEPCATYDGTITINSDDGTKTGAIRVYVTSPILCTNPDPPDRYFGDVPEGETRSWSFDITNCGCDSGTLTWSIDSDGSWITTDPTSGSTTTETDTITITIDTTGLQPCVTYDGTITIDSNGGTKTGAIGVHVTGGLEAITLRIKGFTSSSVTLEWDQCTAAHFTRYEVHKSTEENFIPSATTRIQSITNRNTTEYTVENLSLDTDYYFKVRAVAENACTSIADSNEVLINLCEDALSTLLYLLNCNYAHYDNYKSDADDSLTAPDPWPATVDEANEGWENEATQDIWMIFHPASISLTLEKIGYDLNDWYEDGGKPVQWTAPSGNVTKVKHSELGINLTDFADFVEDFGEFFEKWGTSFTFLGKYAYAPLECDNDRAEVGLIVKGRIRIPQAPPLDVVSASAQGTIYYDAATGSLKQTPITDFAVEFGAIDIGDYEFSLEKSLNFTIKHTFKVPIVNKEVGIDETVNVGTASFELSFAPAITPGVGIGLQDITPTCLKLAGKMDFNAAASGSFTSDFPGVSKGINLCTPGDALCLTGTVTIDAPSIDATIEGSLGDEDPYILAELIFPLKDDISVTSVMELTTEYTQLKAWNPVLRIKTPKISPKVTATVTLDPGEIETAVWLCPLVGDCYGDSIMIDFPVFEEEFTFEATSLHPSLYIPAISKVWGTTTIKGGSPVDILIYDGQGNRVGYAGGEVYGEITDATVDPEAEEITVPSTVGPFFIEVVGTGGGTYDLTVDMPVLVSQPDGTLDITYATYALDDVTTATDDEDNFVLDPESVNQGIQEGVDAGQDVFTAISEVIGSMDADQDGIPDVEDTEMTYEKEPTAIVMESITSVAGKEETISARLNSFGTAVAGETITFYLDASEIGSAVTDYTGTASFDYQVSGDKPAGEYVLRAEFPGSANFYSSTAATSLFIEEKPPVIGVQNPAHGATVSGNVQIEATVADENLEEIELKIDGTAVAFQETTIDDTTEISYTWDTTEVQDGVHSIFISAVDATGLSDGCAISVYVNNSAPSAPTNLIAAATEDEVWLSWNPNLEGDIDNYRVYRSSSSYTMIGQVAHPQTSYTDSDVTTGTTYHYVVRAVDRSDLESGPSPAVEVTPQLDTTPPTAAIAISPESPVGVTYLTILLETSEALPSTPTLGLILPGETEAIPLSLFGHGDAWITAINITPTTPSGIATFQFSGTDAAGHEGTTITSGGSFEVDTGLTIDCSPESFDFYATQGGANPADQILEIWNSGSGTLNWSVSDDADWLNLDPASGSSTGEHDAVTVSVDISGMSAGNYSATITISAPGATNTPQTVPVTLHVFPGPILELVEGVNIILYTGATTSLPEALTNIADLVEIIWARGIWTGGEWHRFFFYNGFPMGELEELEDGRAYIIVLSEHCIWELPQ